MYQERNHIKVFVSSTVYDFESQLDMVYSTLDGYGYDVMMSHKGTIPLDSKLSNLENCLKGVEGCDIFLGFVRPLTGTGILKPGEKSITAQEFEVAFKVNMPRFVLADYRVVFARQFTNLMRIPTGDIPNSVKRERSDGSIVERPNRVVHAECIELYNAAIQNNTLPKSRKGNWVQEYRNMQDVMLHVEAQFKDVERIKQLIGSHE
jgi:hypothetical protein